MSNMSYCRFENTHDDLEDCVHALEEGLEVGQDIEKENRDLLYEQCRNYIYEYERLRDVDFNDEVEDDEDEDDD